MIRNMNNTNTSRCFFAGVSESKYLIIIPLVTFEGYRIFKGGGGTIFYE